VLSGVDLTQRLTKQDLIAWRDARLKTHSVKTVADVYLAAVRTVLTWAGDCQDFRVRAAG
jgi:hypothetical protein